MRDVIARIVDGSRFREFKKEYGTTMITVSVFLSHRPCDLSLLCDRVSRTYMAIKSELLLIMEFYSPPRR